MGPLAAAGAAAVAFLPQFVFVSSSLNNDAPAIFLAALFFLLLLRWGGNREAEETVGRLEPPSLGAPVRPPGGAPVAQHGNRGGSRASAPARNAGISRPPTR